MLKFSLSEIISGVVNIVTENIDEFYKLAKSEQSQQNYLLS